MAFNIANFAPGANTSKRLRGVGTSSLYGAPSIHTYATADTINMVTASGYFNDVAAKLSIGDIIHVVSGAGSGGTPAVTLVYVNAISASNVVDVTDGTTISANDTY